MKNSVLQNELTKLMGDKCSLSESVRYNYSRGEDVFDPVVPDAVLFPETNQEVSAIVKICNNHKTPIVPFGTGTSLEGSAVGIKNGITISLEKMNKILNVNEEDFDCRV